MIYKIETVLECVMSTFLVVVASIIGFITLFFVLLYVGSSGLRKAAHQFTSALKNREFDVAYSILTPDFKALVDRLGFEEYLIQHQIFDIKEIKNLGDHEIGLKSGTVKPIIIRKDSVYFPLIIEMVKINGKWLVYSLGANVQLTPLTMKSFANDESEQNNEMLQEKNKNHRTIIH